MNFDTRTNVDIYPLITWAPLQTCPAESSAPNPYYILIKIHACKPQLVYGFHLYIVVVIKMAEPQDDYNQNETMTNIINVGTQYGPNQN
jgi:hypothetical protein